MSDPQAEAKELRAAREHWERSAVRLIRAAVKQRRGGTARLLAGLHRAIGDAYMSGRIQGRKSERDPGGRDYDELIGRALNAFVRGMSGPSSRERSP